MLRQLLNILKGVLFPRSSCDKGALLNAAARGDVTEFLQLLGDANPDLRFSDGSTILDNVTVSPFMNAASRLEVLQALHKSGATIDLPNREGATPLMFAVGTGEEPLCRTLLDMGASLTRTDYHGDTVLIWAASTSRLSSLQFLIERGADVNHRNKYKRSPLMYAARQGNVAHVEELLAAGADPQALDREGTSALKIACLLGRAEAAELLTSAAPELKRSLTLHAAASVGFDDVVSSCIKEGALFTEKNENGFTPLELAVIYQRKSTVELLLPHYAAEPKVRGLALASAALSNAVEIMEILLKDGADPNCADEKGDTPLILAAGKNHADAVALLFQYRAVKSVKNAEGDDAQDVAQANKAYDALQVIFKAH